VPSINELLTKKLNLEEISPRRKYLLQQYRNLGQLIQNHKAITEGHFYDLSWANLEKNDKVYIFLRHDQNERLLFAVNFSHTEKVLTQLHIPSHAIELLGITINKLIKSQNLFSFGSVASELQFYWETNGMRTTEPLELPPLGVQICKLVV
jgi:glycosidase